MSGRIRSRATVSFLNAMGDAWCERTIYDRLAEGITTRDVVKELIALAMDEGYYGPLVRSGLYEWREETPERRKAWERAIKLGGESRIEEAGIILDDLAAKRFVSPEEVKIGDLRAKYRVWLGTVTDRERYGEKHIVNTTHVTVNDLHLHASRGVNSALQDAFERPVLPASTDEVIVEAEVIEETPTSRLDDIFGIPGVTPARRSRAAEIFG